MDRVKNMPIDNVKHFAQEFIMGHIELGELPAKLRNKVKDFIEEKEKEDAKIQTTSSKVQAKSKATGTRKKGNAKS